MLVQHVANQLQIFLEALPAHLAKPVLLVKAKQKLRPLHKVDLFSAVVQVLGGRCRSLRYRAAVRASVLDIAVEDAFAVEDGRRQMLAVPLHRGQRDVQGHQGVLGAHEGPEVAGLPVVVVQH